MSNRRSSDVDAIRNRSAAAGRAADRMTASLLGRVEGLSLWAFEQAAAMRPEHERLASAERCVRELQSLASPLPRLVGRLVAGSAYFGMRWPPEALRTANDIRREASAFVASGAKEQED
jgi:hypothetical protein